MSNDLKYSNFETKIASLNSEIEKINEALRNVKSAYEGITNTVFDGKAKKTIIDDKFQSFVNNFEKIQSQGNSYIEFIKNVDKIYNDAEVKLTENSSV